MSRSRPQAQRLIDGSSAFWHLAFTKGANDTTIEFTYDFDEPGNGNQLGIWVDDGLRFIITGQLVGTETYTSDIDISDLAIGDHVLSVALYDYGGSDASVDVGNFTMISVPEPSTAALLAAGVVGLVACAARWLSR